MTNQDSTERLLEQPDTMIESPTSSIESDANDDTLLTGGIDIMDVSRDISTGTKVSTGTRSPSQQESPKWIV